MLLHSTEVLVLEVVAFLIIGAILVGIADTPLYPLAFGIEIVALFFVLLPVAGKAPSGLMSFLQNPAKLAGG